MKLIHLLIVELAFSASAFFHQFQQGLGFTVECETIAPLPSKIPKSCDVIAEGQTQSITLDPQVLVRVRDVTGQGFRTFVNPFPHRITLNLKSHDWAGHVYQAAVQNYELGDFSVGLADPPHLRGRARLYEAPADLQNLGSATVRLQDIISSIELAPFTGIEVHQHFNYGGHPLRFENWDFQTHVYELEDTPFDNMISAVKMFKLDLQ